MCCLAPRTGQRIRRTGSWLACCALLAIVSLIPSRPTLAAEEIQPLAHDGLSLAEQPPSVQMQFRAVWGGDAAGARWVQEHNAELARGRSGPIPRIAFFASGSQLISPEQTRDAFLGRLRELGYEPGTSIDVEWRYAEGRTDQLPAMAAELSSLPVDLIVVPSTPEALAAKEAGNTPIVMVSVGDPVGVGLAESLERPGGQATGLIFNPPEFPTRRLELLVEAVPSARRIAMLWNSANPAQRRPVRFTEMAAERLGIELQSVEVTRAEDVDGAFRQAIDASADAVLIIPDQLFNLPATQARLVALAEQNRIPTMHLGRGPVEAGGLMAYAVANPALYRRAADYVARILNGARPADLPIESPPEFELVLNLSAAQAIGFTFPPSILDRAGTVLP